MNCKPYTDYHFSAIFKIYLTGNTLLAFLHINILILLHLYEKIINYTLSALVLFQQNEVHNRIDRLLPNLYMHFMAYKKFNLNFDNFHSCCDFGMVWICYNDCHFWIFSLYILYFNTAFEQYVFTTMITALTSSYHDIHFVFIQGSDGWIVLFIFDNFSKECINLIILSINVNFYKIYNPKNQLAKRLASRC